MTTLVCFYTASLVLSLVVTYFAMWLGRRLALTDRLDARKVHKDPVPRIGGLAIYVVVVCMGLLAFTFLHQIDGLTQRSSERILALFFGATVVFLLGLVDDICTLRARVKLCVQLVAATLVCWGGGRIGSITVAEWSPISLHWLAWPITILWIVGITNAVNLSDGVDGLAAGVSVIACSVVALLAFQSDQSLIGLLMLAMVGALTGFLYFNFHPARIFMGDSGSLFLGFVISVSSVLCFMESHALVALALPAVALGIPILDTLLSMLRRFVTRRPIFAPDRGHLHHRLLQLGLGQRQTVGIICVLTLFATCLGLRMLQADARTSLALCGGLTIFLLSFFCAVGVVRPRAVLAGLKHRLYIDHQRREEISEFCNLQNLFEQADGVGSWWQALCRAADQLEFAWVSLDVTDHEGNLNTYLWRRSRPLPQVVRLTIVKVPIQTLVPDRPIEIEVAVLTNGSLEGATRRASLLGRLLDDYQMPVSNEAARQFDAAIQSMPLKNGHRSQTEPVVADRLGTHARASQPSSEPLVSSSAQTRAGETRAARI